MKAYIEERVYDVAYYLIEKEATIRDTAKRFGVSKSTVHRDLRERLPKLDRALYGKVDEVLNNNLAERHIRGGMSLRKKFKEGEVD